MTVFLAAIDLALSVGAFVLSADFQHLAGDPAGPAFFPRVVAAITGVACVLVIVQALQARRPGRATRASITPGAWAREHREQIVLFCLVFLLPVGIEFIGFVAAIFLFTYLTMLILRTKTVTALVASGAITAAIYVAYAVLLQAVLPVGSLFS